MILYWTLSSRNLSDCTDRSVAHFGYSNVGGSESFAILWYRLGAACLVLWYTWYYDISSFPWSLYLEHIKSRLLFSDSTPPMQRCHYTSSRFVSFIAVSPITCPWANHMEVLRTVQCYKKWLHMFHTVRSIHAISGPCSYCSWNFSSSFSILFGNISFGDITLHLINIFK